MAQVRPDQLPRLHWQVPSRPGMQVPWPSQRAHGMQSGPKLLAAHSLQVGPLKPGDVCIGLGTAHTWFNHGTVPCRSVTMLIDGKPKRAGSVAGMQQQTEK